MIKYIHLPLQARGIFLLLPSSTPHLRLSALICVIMDRVELTARLSAFDSFLFLASNEDDQGGGGAVETIDVQSEKKFGATGAVNNGGTAAGATPTKGLANVRKGDGPSASQLPIVQVQSESATIPIVESNIRRIPGGDEEWQEMSSKLSAFDQYMFLLETSDTDKIPPKNKQTPTKKRIAEEVTLMETKIPKKQLADTKKQEPQRKI
jgi:small nuclear ribonucleoprotein (snRNP)-like protein